MISKSSLLILKLTKSNNLFILATVSDRSLPPISFSKLPKERSRFPNPTPKSHQKLRGNYVFSKYPATNQKLPLPFTRESRSASDTLRDRALPKIQQTETGAIFVILVIFVGHYCDAIVVFQRHAIASLFLSAIPSAIAIKNSEVIMSSQNILQQIKNSHSLLPASRDPPLHPTRSHLSQKPGFSNNFCIPPKYLGRNPVSLSRRDRTFPRNRVSPITFASHRNI